MNIRKFNYSDQDYHAAIHISNRIWTDVPSTITEWQHSDKERDPKYFHCRYMLEDESANVVAYGAVGEPSWSYEPGKFYFSLEVDPAHRQHGYGTQLYQFLMAAIDKQNPPTSQIDAHTREDQTAGTHFLNKQGYEQVMRFPRSWLMVQDFDPGRYTDSINRTLNSGIVIKSLAQLAQDHPDWLERFWNTHWELLQDVPYHAKFTKKELPIFEKTTVNSPNFIPEANLMAIDGDQWVGYTSLWSSLADEKRLYNGLTGVSRTHRRRGIATALKVAATQFAQQYGAEIIETDNEENNPMYDLNMQLGYLPQPAWLDFVKKIK